MARSLWTISGDPLADKSVFLCDRPVDDVRYGCI